MEKIITGFNPVNEGWQYMWVITLLGMIGLGIAVERFIYIFLKSSRGRGVFMHSIANLLKAGKFDEAQNLAGSTKLPIARILYSILSHREKGKDAMKEAFEETYMTEAPRINRYIVLLQISASVSTLLGLLGDCWGLIVTFDAIANKPAAERPKAMADGIAMAMAATYMGLVVAIPLLVVQGLFSMQSERLIEELEEKGMKVINILG